VHRIDARRQHCGSDLFLRPCRGEALSAAQPGCPAPRRQGGSCAPPPGLILDQADGKQIFIWADGRRGAEHATSFKADQTIGGHPAQWLTGGSSGTGLWIPDFGPIDLFITGVTASDSGWLRQDDARWLAERLLPSRNTGDPGSWPWPAVA
jgi:hypothetical protein